MKEIEELSQCKNEIAQQEGFENGDKLATKKEDDIGTMYLYLQDAAILLQQSHQKLKDATVRLLEWHDTHYDISFIDADIIEAFKQALTNEG